MNTKIHRNPFLQSLAFICMYLALSGFAGCQENSGESLTIMSYNVRNGRGMDNITDYQRVADIINRVNPDIVALQELDSATQRSEGIVLLDELSRRTGMLGTYGPAIDYQGGKYGVGILTRNKPLSTRIVPLPGTEEKRILLLVEMESYVLGCTHFSLTQEDRMKSAEIISSSVTAYNKPVFLAGDINDLPDSEVLTLLEQDWNTLSNKNLPTYRSDRPEKCIDYIFGYKNDYYVFEVIEALVGSEPVASDHSPLWVKVHVTK